MTSCVCFDKEGAWIKLGEVSVRLTSLYLLVMNQLHRCMIIFFSFLKQANPKYKEFSSTYTSPMTERRQSLRMQQVCELSSPVFKPAAAERARTRLKSSSKFLAVFEKDLHVVLSGRGRCRRHRR